MIDDKNNIQVVILAGGMGIRLREQTEFIPKPMVLVGDRPILWHIMKIYSYYGFKNFIICLGYKGEIIKDYEGCLSVPEVYGLVPRYNKIRVKALDANGNEIRFKSSGFLARIIQHEIDHVNGIVFIDHIRDTKDAFYKLDEEGELKPLDYEKHIRNNDVLWL